MHSLTYTIWKSTGNSLKNTTNANVPKEHTKEQTAELKTTLSSQRISNLIVAATIYE